MQYFKSINPKEILRLIETPDLKREFTVYRADFKGPTTVLPDHTYPDGKSLEDKKMEYRFETEVHLDVYFTQIGQEEFDRLRQKVKFNPDSVELPRAYGAYSC